MTPQFLVCVQSSSNRFILLQIRSHWFNLIQHSSKLFNRVLRLTLLQVRSYISSTRSNTVQPCMFNRVLVGSYCFKTFHIGSTRFNKTKQSNSSRLFLLQFSSHRLNPVQHSSTLSNEVIVGIQPASNQFTSLQSGSDKFNPVQSSSTVGASCFKSVHIRKKGLGGRVVRETRKGKGKERKGNEKEIKKEEKGKERREKGRII